MGHIDKHVKVGDIIEEQVKVGASLSVAPVNLDKKIAAANSPDKSRLHTEDNECVLMMVHIILQWHPIDLSIILR